MNGSCVMEAHSACPDRKNDTMSCTCPCHIFDTVEDYRVHQTLTNLLRKRLDTQPAD